MEMKFAQDKRKTSKNIHKMALEQKLISDQNSKKLELSEEEKNTLLYEGYPIPEKYPLTKTEEETMKIVRRKIRNRLSAQESRRKKKELIDDLRSKLGSLLEENESLKQQITQLEASNRDLQTKLYEGESENKKEIPV
uniref:BZIP domain-containing protein n=2 Tax=Caenorhabditis tropicalis TaxID=1561998 RepID=A0A1I7SZJ2_9PELO